MKKILFISLLLGFTTVSAYAVDARSIRTSTDMVTYDDSVGSMLSKLGRPESKNEYTSRDARGKLMFLTDYYYTIDNLKYTVTIWEGKVFRIQWER